MDTLTVVSHILLFVALYTEVYLLLAYLDAREDATQTRAHKDAALPTVAIVVPCFNEEATVAGTIHSLLALSYPREKLSVIAVNDGSTDGTKAALDAFSCDPRVTILHKENGGKHTAMNLALAHTSAEIVGCLDADSFVAPDALRASVARFLETGAAAVTPAIVSHSADNWLRLVQQAEYMLAVFMYRAFAAADAVFITPGPFSLFRASVLRTLGGWKHAHGTEDMEIALRMRERGYLITNTPHARVFTKTPRTVPALYRQRVRWTYGFLMNVIDYRHMVLNRGYGTLGMLVLPTALLSIVAALYFTLYALTTAGVRAFEMYERISIQGLSLSMPLIDVFYFNTTSAALLGYSIMALTLTLIFLGRSLVRAPLHPLSIPLYVALYSILAPWWLFGAVARASVRAQAPWR